MATDKITIESYSKHAKSRADRIKNKDNMAHEYLEKPAMYKLLPDLRNKKVLCLGCGSGEECEYLSSLGADVTGVDIAPGMIEIAKKLFPEIKFEVMDMEELKYENESFDYIFCSLTLHYAQKWDKVLSECFRILTKEGEMLYSTQHPVSYNAKKDKTNEYHEYILGYRKKLRDRSIEIFGDYFNNEKNEKIWPGNFKIYYYNRPISQMVNETVNAGFKIIEVIEPKPTEESKQVDPGFYKLYSKIPLFIIFKVRK